MTAALSVLTTALAANRFGESDHCAGGACCGMANYPVGNPTDGFNTFYAEFDVPGLPEKIDGITNFIYFNIFFDNGPPNGKMNQFVPQLMLGEPLDGSSGPPYYLPEWHERKTWVFASQYFMELHNVTTNSTASHAAAGELYNCTKGEILYTEFKLDDSYTWTLTMGVKGDPSRVSVIKAEKPYMGLLEENPGKGAKAPRWTDDAFNHTYVNSCWELYGMKDRAHYPSSGSHYDMQVRAAKPDSIKWDTNWTEDEKPTCPGGPKSKISEYHNSTVQHILWDLYW
eukprot:TRINITY_DN1143_c0_g2_i2.p1 TRINITY_DN1143_c0_g2~~TRINITY_DN1143_c0_g2_i2.p1  ORF type:complete len:297 (+),score=75.40 TRINITY_DN1143_c0_g2_i2:42-893(+)